MHGTNMKKKLKITSCGWRNRNKDPSNKVELFYFINACLFPKLLPKFGIDFEQDYAYNFKYDKFIVFYCP